MAFDVTGLVDFTNENQFDLMRATVLGAKMMDLTTVVPNIKGPSKLPQISSSVFFQTDGCSFNASGDTTFTQRTLTPGKVRVNSEWCDKDLEPKYLATQLTPGAMKDKVEPDEVWRMILDEYTSKIARDIDVAIWRGDTAGGPSNNQFWDGYIKLLTSGTIDANTGGTPLGTLYTQAAAREAMERLYLSAATNGLADFADGIAYVGYDLYALLYSAMINGGSTNGMALNQAPSGNADPDDSGAGLIYPGMNMRIVPVNGLTGQEKTYFARKSNMFIGVDAEGDFENFETWYSQDDRKVKLAVEFKLGCQVAFPGEVVSIII